MQRPISTERNVPLAYEAAVAALTEEPARIVLDDEDRRSIDLHAGVAGFDVAREVAVDVGSVSRLDAHAVVLPLAWEAVEHPRRFPTFDGMLELSAMSKHPPQTQVALIGTVRVPFGVMGTIGESFAGTELGDAVLDALLDRFVDRLRDVVRERQRAAAASAAAGHLHRPRRAD